MNNSAVLFFVALTAALLAPTQTSTHVRSVEFVAHRGASFDAPENTVAAAKTAWSQNADAVETDIRLTKDGEVIVSHDANTRRTTGRNALISDLTLAEARSLDAGRQMGADFAGEKLPTLDELIETIPAGKRLFVEIKTGPEILPALEKTLARTRASEKNIVLISFDLEVLRQAHQKWPQYTTLWLVGYDGSRSVAQLIETARQAGLSGLDLSSSWPLDIASVKQIKAAQLQLHVWTIDDLAVAKRWIKLGADGVTTNQAGWMREQLAT